MTYHSIKKIVICGLLCVFLLCSACAVSEEDKKGDTQEECSWGKHAFLLNDEDIFFASMPDDWRSFRPNNTYNTLVFIYCPDEEMLSNGWEAYYTLSIKEYTSEIFLPMDHFIFADGQTGEKYVIDDNRKNKLPNWKDQGEHTDGIISADKKYLFSTSTYKTLTNGQYEKYLKYAEKFYNSMIFQKGQIGLLQEDLTKQDMVRLHIGGRLCLDVTVPEGMFFEVRGSDDTDYSLFFYLDEKKENYIEICNDYKGDRSDEFWELYGKMLTDPTYEEDAEYTVKISNNKTNYKYNFLCGRRVLAEILVPEDNGQMLKMALDIVRSIRFR